MINWIYYTFWNLCYYYKERPIKQQQVTDFHKTRNSGLQAMRDSVTDIMLSTVGLKIVSEDSETVPWYIPLSKSQKSWIKLVSEHKYKVGLR